MTETFNAVHPVKDKDGKVIKPGAPVDPKKFGDTRLKRLVDKGRVSEGARETPLNRAESITGRPALKASPSDD